ncbi:DNA-binding response regulator [Alginatibacterium sediminis]|uniref:DNA-binding response regulator n=1 Tax=Alginatibacterium sediminis TaxID=2164068 RepID=A0A420E6W6_9ALTE|nr:response regulator transcription factor [Alginatibacterium sediminis]RKF14292.1 DNA-binding response regulator [Alginatibacterium sediminis]
MIRILLVDDHPLVQDGLRMRLEAQEQFEVVGVAENGEEAFEKALLWRPDIVLTDINMPRLNGIGLLEKLSKHCPNCKTVILSMHDNREYIENAMNNGAKGYLLKDIASSELINALIGVANGGSYFSAGVSQIMFDKNSAGATKAASLTKREEDVLRLLSQGSCNRVIAESLSISIRTVETHTLKIRRKLELENSAAMMKYAIEKYPNH